MPPRAHDSQIADVDGSNSWSGGVDSIKVPTIATQSAPDGLARNQVSWSNNVTFRGGGITIRAGWNSLGTVHGGSALFQGGFIYEPDGANPYLILSIGGHIFKVLPDDPGSAVDLSVAFGLVNPPFEETAYFVQAELFAVIQAGDYGKGGPVIPGTTDAFGNTLPLFWDGTTLTRSKGIVNTVVAPGTPGINGIPAGMAMDYYQGRVWYAQKRNYSAGDIVGGNSGTAAYRFRDAVLNVTENPMVVGGDGFTVPTNAGDIRALKHSANLDSTLGQGRLYVFTRKTVYALSVPITRTDWIAANKNNAPLQTVVQLVNGAVNDRSVVAVNGDLFYQSLEPGIRSLITAIRYFDQWGNTQVGNNVNRALQFNDRSLLHAATGIEFDNRLWQSCLPKRLPQGIVHQGILTLDFTPLSTFESTAPPVWEGMYEGLDILQMFTGDFGGLQRAFGLAVNKDTGAIELWEFTQAERFNEGDKRTRAYIEFPAFNFGSMFQLKELLSAELWVDRIFGEVVFKMEYRPDGDPCWYLWHEWKKCTSRNTCEDVNNPVCYPVEGHRESFDPGSTLPKPPLVCDPVSKQPTNLGFQFQCKLSVIGFCRIRGLYLYAANRVTELYRKKVC